jgi:tRNA threonylcarbamoyladenosine biosynthesis protein TsaE
MSRVTIEFNLPDSSVTEALGQALARSLPRAVHTGAVPTGGVRTDAVYTGAVRTDTERTDAVPTGAVRTQEVHTGAVRTEAAPTGAVLYLQGELGAGKTTCVRSLLRTLGVTGLVRSPTYTLVEAYYLATLTCVHVDLYRLQSLTEVDELGLRDLVEPGSLIMVEWPEKGGVALPPADLDLTLRYAGEARQAALSAKTLLGTEWLQNLGRDSGLGIPRATVA